MRVFFREIGTDHPGHLFKLNFLSFPSLHPDLNLETACLLHTENLHLFSLPHFLHFIISIPIPILFSFLTFRSQMRLEHHRLILLCTSLTPHSQRILHYLLILHHNRLLNQSLIQLLLQTIIFLHQLFIQTEQGLVLLGRLQGVSRRKGWDEVIVGALALEDLGLGEGELFFQVGVLELQGGGLGEVVGGRLCHDLYDFLVLGDEERGDGLGKAFWLTGR